MKISLHESGSWQAGLTSKSTAHHLSTESRHWDIWKRGGELALGVTRAWYLLIPDQELREGICDLKAHQIPSVGADHAASIEFLIMSNEGSPVGIDDAYVIGRWLLKGRDECCLIVARRIRWPEELQAWAESAQRQAAANAETARIPKSTELRYFFHGYDVDGVRFGLELAGT